jgi:hypothetical protein
MCDNFLYVFKGARSAPDPGWSPILVSAKQDALTPDAAQLPPVDRLALNRGAVARLAPPAALWPCRATAASARALSPRPTVRAGHR